MHPDQLFPKPTRFLPWLCLTVAVVWVVLLRIPLVLNARIHLDSDLAVDGLTLLEAVQGHWRWHYPGTPFSGILPVLLSWPQAKLWGATPETLVSGGVVAHLALLIAVYALAYRCFGPIAAIASLVPLTFASTGTIWLSGRITGGHLPVAAWSAGAWLLLLEAIRRRHWLAYAVLGAWSGLGLYLDSMFVMTIGGMAVAWLTAWVSSLRTTKQEGQGGVPIGSGWARALALVLAFSLGVAPRFLGRWLEPHDAYQEQMAVTLQAEALTQHGGLLLRDCLPRLIAGHRLPGLEADPDPLQVGFDAPVRKRGASRDGFGVVALLATVLSLTMFVCSLTSLARFAVRGADRPSRAMAVGILASSIALTIAFLVNRNIFNADNYRYLVLLLVPWALGFGVLIDGWLRRKGLLRTAAIGVLIAIPVLFTADTAAWYRQFGWVDQRSWPVRRPLEDPALKWLAENRGVQAVFGGYWDVYRLSFLTGGDVKGIPYPIFPNRFPEWVVDLPGGRPETLLARGTPEGRMFLETALREGGEVLHRRGGLTMVHWPWPGRGRQRQAR